ncbi:MAG: Hcp family type VI secretion system effector [Pseudomonadota bacterium]
MIKENSLKVVGIAVFMLMMISGDVNAGDLNPSSAPGSTMHTLSEIYDKIGSTSTSATQIPSASIFGIPSGIYATMEGINQGIIEGDCTVPGKEKSIMVLGFEHKVTIPRDEHTGLPTGQRVHGPVTIIKYIDKSSPLIFSATCTGEQMKEVAIKFYRTNGANQEEHYYTIKLNKAIIVETQSLYPNYEKISVTYEKIIWTYEPEGIETEDSWRRY